MPTTIIRYLMDDQVREKSRPLKSQQAKMNSKHKKDLYMLNSLDIMTDILRVGDLSPKVMPITGKVIKLCKIGSHFLNTGVRFFQMLFISI